MRPIPSASALVVREGRVLLVRRGREPEPEAWSLPAGLVRYGETVEQAAVRETLEETGISIAIRELLGVYDLLAEAYHYVVICFLAKPLGGRIRPGPDVEDARWFRLEELNDIELMRITRAALRDAGLLPEEG